MTSHPWIGLVALVVLEQGAPLPQFDVASVKPNVLMEQPSNNWSRTPGRTDFHNSQLVELVKRAWGDAQLPNQAIERQPDWMVRGRFDVVVQYPVDTDPATQMLMLRALLMDRFTLAAHFETREVSSYSLVFARADRRLGPRIGPPLADCRLATGGNPPPGDPPVCGPGDDPGLIKFGNVKVSNIAAILSRRLGRRVVNNTGLIDGYRIELKYTPPQLLSAAPDPGAAARLTLEADAPDVFIALQEQLGLKLEQVKSQGQALVIDHIEQPTPD